VSGLDEFRVALLGCGRIARNHVEAIAQVEGLRVVAVADIERERADALARLAGGVPAYGALADMLAGTPCDLVVVATPSGLHPAHGILAAEAGKHVLSEKPMAISLEAADRLIAACDRAGVQLFVVKQNRLNPTVQLLHRAVAKGRFGRLYTANCTVRWTRPQEYYDQAPWRGTWAYDGGAFLNQASHYVDLMQWLMGPPSSVVAETATLARRIEAEDTGAAVVRFTSGALGVFDITMLTYPKNLEGSITLIGERGTARIGGTAVNRIEHWQFADYDDEDRLVDAANTNPPSVYGFGHVPYYRNVVSVLRGEARPDTDGREGRKSLELVLGIYEAARTGSAVRFPLPYGTGHPA